MKTFVSFQESTLGYFRDSDMAEVDITREGQDLLGELTLKCCSSEVTNILKLNTPNFTDDMDGVMKDTNQVPMMKTDLKLSTDKKMLNGIDCKNSTEMVDGHDLPTEMIDGHDLPTEMIDGHDLPKISGNHDLGLVLDDHEINSEKQLQLEPSSCSPSENTHSLTGEGAPVSDTEQTSSVLNISKEDNNTLSSNLTLRDINFQAKSVSGNECSVARVLQEEHSTPSLPEKSLDVVSEKAESFISEETNDLSAEHDSALLSESTEEHTVEHGNTETSLDARNEVDSVLNCEGISLVQDAEDELEGSEMTAKIEDCFTISDTEMDYPENESESADSGHEIKADEGKTDVHLEAGDEGKTLNETETMIDPGLISADGETYSEEPELERTDEDACSIKIAESVSVAEDVSADSESDLRLFIAVTDDEQEDNGMDTVEASSPLHSENNIFETDLISSSHLQQNECLSKTQTTEGEISNVYTKKDNLENEENKQSEIICDTEENKLIEGDKDMLELDIEVDRLPAKNEKSVNYSSGEVKDLHAVNNVSQKTETEMDDSDFCADLSTSSERNREESKSPVQCQTHVLKKKHISECEENKLVKIKGSDTLHSKQEDCDSENNGRDTLDTPGRIEFADVDSQNKEEPVVTSLDLKKLHNKELLQNANGDIRIEKVKEVVEEKSPKEEGLLKHGEKIYDSKEDVDESDMDDEVVFVDDAGETEPVDCSVQKHSFKNSLPNSVCKTRIISNSEKDSIVIDEPETLGSAELAVKDKPLTPVQTVDGKITDQHDEKSGELKTAESPVAASGGKMEENLSAQKRESPAGNDRKRQKAEDGLSAPKRPRLDLMVERSENHVVEESRDIAEEVSEVLDSDDDVILAEETPTANSAGEVSTKPRDDTPVVLTSEALQSLIAIRVRAFIRSQKQANLEKLSVRTRGMQSASNLWKETAKHLERSVVELTALNQKLEKRKAHSNSMKQQTSRTVSVQVGERKVNSMNTVMNGSPKTGTPNAACGLPPSVLTNSSPQTQQFIRHQQIVSSPSSNPVMRSPSMTTHSPVHRGPGRPPRPLVPPLTPMPSPVPQRLALASQGRAPQSPSVRHPSAPISVNNVVNLIDLTEEEDTTRKTVSQISKVTPAPPMIRNISKLPMGTRDSVPRNGSIHPGSASQGASNILMGSNNQILQTSSPSSQSHLASNRPSVGGAGSQYQFQLVTVGNSAAPRSDPGFAVVPGLRPAAPARVPVGTGQSMASPPRRAVPQNGAHNVPSAASTTTRTTSLTLPPSFLISQKHPAPLPSTMDTGNAPVYAKNRPPKPGLKISRVSQGIVLSWNMPSLHNVEKIASYQLFAYQESDSAIPRSSLWKKVGDVKALPLPMACTLTQFQEGNKYHFAVRAIDQYGRWGSYSDPSSIFLGPKS